MPTQDAYGQGVPIAAKTDAPDAEKLAGDIVNGIVPRAVMRFTSASARAATLTAPAAGMATWLIAEGRLEIYHNGAWVTWRPEPVITSQVQDAPYNVAQTTVDYSAAAWPRPQFVVPPSGKAKVTVSAGISNSNTVTSTIWVAWRATGSQGYTYTDLNVTGMSSQGGRIVASKSTLLTGLTVGEVITLIPQWNISSGSSATASTFGGRLLVEPV